MHEMRGSLEHQLMMPLALSASHSVLRWLSRSFLNAFSKTPLPMVPSTKPSTRPLRFFPSRTTTTSMSVANPQILAFVRKNDEVPGV